ncbi:hypothetical protein SNEBB_010216 [Seison nebaliae]|nr:hypothetical protein SNEBB_010216 [Seison nebaliae]
MSNSHQHTYESGILNEYGEHEFSMRTNNDNEGNEENEKDEFNNSTVIPLIDSTNFSNDNNENSNNNNNNNNNLSLFSFAYYQTFFDIDTKDVLLRMRKSLFYMPRFKRSNSQNQAISHEDGDLYEQILMKPDLYGPFWIAVTLIFSVAILGNVSAFIQLRNNSNVFIPSDFHSIIVAVCVIFSYSFFIPLIIHWWHRCQYPSMAPSSLLQLICVFGYSLTIYLPASILWLFQWLWLQWLVAAIATTCSLSVLIPTLLKIYKESKLKLPIIILTIVTNLCVICAFVFYFYHVPNVQSTPVDPITTTMETVIKTTMKSVVNATVTKRK